MKIPIQGPVNIMDETFIQSITQKQNELNQLEEEERILDTMIDSIKAHIQEISDNTLYKEYNYLTLEDLFSISHENELILGI